MTSNITRSNKKMVSCQKKSRRYSIETMTYADYADDLALLANIPAQAKSLLYSLEQPAGGIGLSVNANHILIKKEPFPH